MFESTFQPIFVVSLFLLQDFFFLTNLRNESPSCWQSCTMTRHFRSNSSPQYAFVLTALHVDSSVLHLISHFNSLFLHFKSAFMFNFAHWLVFLCIPEPFSNDYPFPSFPWRSPRRGDPQRPPVPGGLLGSWTSWTSWSKKTLTTKMGWNVNSKIKSRFRARI